MKPIILQYAIKREEKHNSFIYHYDFTESLNVLCDENRKPFIDSSLEDISLMTKTRVRSESDDESFNILDLQTKTKVKQEADDDHNILLELQTKTFSSTERDD